MSKSWRDRVQEALGGETLPLRRLPEFQGRWLLFPDDWFMDMWAMLVTLLLIYTATITPYRVALVETEEEAWVALDYAIDIIFGIDVCLNCVLCYYDEESALVSSHRSIFMHYLRTWMIPDIVASLPFQLIISSNYNSLIRVLRLPRVYKLIKLGKLFRILKVVKNRNRLVRYVNSVLRITLSIERLVWMVLWLLLLLHLFACSWVFFGKLNEDEPDNWILCRGYQDYQDTDLYIVALYFSVTTLATVGYGDISACNSTERVVCSIMMLVGIFVYSVTIGSLTNLLANIDRRKAVLNQKMELLVELSSRYDLSKLFFQKLSQALEYEHSNSKQDLSDLVNVLPSGLRTQLLVVIYCQMIEHNAFFEDRTDHFVAWVAPRLIPVLMVEDEDVYQEGEPAREMFFLVRGEVEYVVLWTQGIVAYHVVHSRYHFGEEDLLLSDNRMHAFATRTAQKSELLSFSKEDFDLLMGTFEAEALEIMAMTDLRKKRILEHRVLALEKLQARSSVVRHESAPRRKTEVRSAVTRFIQENAEKDDSPVEESWPFRDSTVTEDSSQQLDFLRLETLSRSETMKQRKKLKADLLRRADKESKQGALKVIHGKVGRMELALQRLCQMTVLIDERLGGQAPDASLEISSGD
jgi:hyperpolarization activated cyclic nucleotide-gated potassium channel 2